MKRATTGSSPKCIFSLIKSKIKLQSSLPTLQDIEGNVILSPTQKAEALAAFFASVFSSSERPLCDVAPVINSTLNDGHGKLSSTHPCEIAVHPQEVLKVLKSFKPSTSLTSDGIPQIIYKKRALSLYKFLTMVFNTSLLFGEIPSV